MNFDQVLGGIACALDGYCASRPSLQPHSCECHCASSETSGWLVPGLLTAIVLLQSLPLLFQCCFRVRALPDFTVGETPRRVRRGVIGGGGIELL